MWHSIMASSYRRAPDRHRRGKMDWDGHSETYPPHHFNHYPDPESLLISNWIKYMTLLLCLTHVLKQTGVLHFFYIWGPFQSVVTAPSTTVPQQGRSIKIMVMKKVAAAITIILLIWLHIVAFVNLEISTRCWMSSRSIILLYMCVVLDLICKII